LLNLFPAKTENLAIESLSVTELSCFFLYGFMSHPADKTIYSRKHYFSAHKSSLIDMLVSCADVCCFCPSVN